MVYVFMHFDEPTQFVQTTKSYTRLRFIYLMI